MNTENSDKFWLRERKTLHIYPMRLVSNNYHIIRNRVRIGICKIATFCRVEQVGLYMKVNMSTINIKMSKRESEVHNMIGTTTTTKDSNNMEICYYIFSSLFM